jgi:hypothetical protein
MGPLRDFFDRVAGWAVGSIYGEKDEAYICKEREG